MVTFLRPHPLAHGPAAVDVRLRIRSKLQSSSSPLVPCCGCSSLSLSSPMAQDPSRPHRQTKEDQDAADTNPQQQPHPDQHDVVQEPAASTSSSSSSGGDTAGSWLQLGVGGGQPGPGSPSPSSSSARRPKRPRTDYEAAGPSTPAGPELGLSLFPGPSSSPASASASVAPVVAAAPPPAHEAGTWFVLQAAQNQRTEPPPLPQIPRSYLRVRDGRMTVRLVMSYLVNKLGLEDDSQLEITCRGQRLLPAMTLQHVRDTIWRPPPAEAAAVLPAPGSSSTNQVMTLHYGRS